LEKTPDTFNSCAWSNASDTKHVADIPQTGQHFQELDLSPFSFATPSPDGKPAMIRTVLPL